MSANLYDVFETRFPSDRSRPFLTMRDGASVTYGDVIEHSGRMANMIASLDIKPGDCVAVQVEKSSATLLFYLACLRAGAIYLPLNTAYTGDELGCFLDDARPALVVCDPARQTAVEPHARKINAVLLTMNAAGLGSLADQTNRQHTDAQTVACASADPAAILYSSGTTGQPKGVVLSHGALAANAEALHEAWTFGPDDVLLHALPLFHTHGLFVATNTLLMNGTGMIFHTRFDAKGVIKDFAKATVFMGVPTYYTRLLSQPELSPEACRSMRLFISGSAPLLEDTFNAFAERTGHTIVERYGMTEAGIITSADPDRPRQAGTVGWPLQGVSLRIADDHDKPLRQGETGGVQIKGTGLFTGYWNKPEKTAEDFTADGYFRTGDLGRLEQNGQLTLVGRAKDLFISGGFNVYPKEIEQAIDALDVVEESAVVGLPHPDFGEAGLAVVVPAEGQQCDPKTIRDALKASLANYKVPKLIVKTDALPRNAMGKVQKAELQMQYRDAWDEALKKLND